MGDTKINYDEKFGMNTFKREICNVMGEKFWDTLTENFFLGRGLEGRVVRSVLNGDLTCEYEAIIPEDIMSKYLPSNEAQTVIENYYRYYRIFGLSDIVELHEGPVDWIIPKTNEVGPSLPIHI